MIATTKNKLLGYLLIEIVDGEFIGASLCKTLTAALIDGTDIALENIDEGAGDNVKRIQDDLQFNGRFCPCDSIQRGWNLYLSPLYEGNKQ